MLKKKVLAPDSHKDSRTIIDEEFARLKKKYGLVKVKTPDPAKVAAAFEKGLIGPDPRVVKLITEWRRSKLEELEARKRGSGEEADSTP